MRMIIDTNAAKLVRRFAKLPAAMRAGIVKSVGAELLTIEGDVTRNAELKWRRGGAGLQGRLTSYSRAHSTLGLDAAIGFRKRRGFPYELAQELGAQARKGGAMAVPISPIARRLADRGISARHSGLDLFRPKGTNILASNLKHGGRDSQGKYISRSRTDLFEPHYALVKSIRPRLGFIRTVTQRLADIGKAILRGAQAAGRAS
jgi:hypothetical protein